MHVHRKVYNRRVFGSGYSGYDPSRRRSQNSPKFVGKHTFARLSYKLLFSNTQSHHPIPFQFRINTLNNLCIYIAGSDLTPP
ncbi:hypothetical protein L2E82_48287 [Cichorium intybus]|uniref:Uncharacterized protein n=1 Tax=Cichorium intybus TaxID=13427 RepID=A0ACB8YX46_CICIN|nr:hypothetical protein L2E82_48287 [Cichorium intybus]